MFNHVLVIRHILIAQHSKPKVRKLFIRNWLMKRLNKPDPNLHTVLIRSRQNVAIRILATGTGTSVADPGCVSRIRIFPSRIPGQKDFGSRIQGQKIPDPGSGSATLTGTVHLFTLVRVGWELPERRTIPVLPRESIIHFWKIQHIVST
jgi:hypothetical protein